MKCETSKTLSSSRGIHVGPQVRVSPILAKFPRHTFTIRRARTSSILIRLNRFWAVFWVDVSSKGTAADGFFKIAKLLEAASEDTDGALMSLANLSHKQSWLLILDNADDIDFDYSCYLPSGNRGVVIITSRNPECGRTYHTVGWKKLDNLDADDCVELLMKSAEVPPESQSTLHADAVSVIKAVGSHTLAIIQAGAYIARGYCSMAKYPDVLNRNRRRLMQFHTTQDPSRYRTAYATLEASMQILERSADDEASQDAHQLLELLSVFHYENFPLAMLESAWKGAYRAHRNSPKDERIRLLTPRHAAQLPLYLCPESDTWQPFRLRQALDRLESLALVRKVDLVHDNSVSMHPLTHEWANFRQTDEQSQLLQCVCAVALAVYSNNNQWLPWYNRFGTHLLRLVRADEHLLNRAAQTRGNLQVCYHIIDLLGDLRLDNDHESLLTGMFDLLGLHNKAPIEDFWPLYELAALHAARLGAYSESIVILEKFARIFDHIESRNEQRSEELSEIKLHLGRVYLRNGQTKQSIEILKKMIRSDRVFLPEDHENLVGAQDTLAKAYLETDQIQNAIKMFQEIVQIREKVLDENHPNQLASQHELARAYLRNNQIQDAIDILQKVVQIRERVQDENHPDRFTSQQLLGVAYLSNGQVRDAIPLLERAEKMFQMTMDEKHPVRRHTQHCLGVAYVQADRLPEAIPLLEHVNRICTLTLGEDNKERTISRQDLDYAYRLRDMKALAGSVASSTVPFPKKNEGRRDLAAEQDEDSKTVGQVGGQMEDEQGDRTSGPEGEKNSAAAAATRKKATATSGKEKEVWEEEGEKGKEKEKKWRRGHKGARRFIKAMFSS